MNKNKLIKLSIILVIIGMTLFIYLAPSVNAVSVKSDEENVIPTNLQEENIEDEDIEEEKIMEYDSATGITREVDMEALTQSLKSKNAKDVGQYNIIESYNPLSEKIPHIIGSRSTYEEVTDLYTMPYVGVCRLKADIYGDTLIASGYVAGPKIVVTAAHCVMNEDDNDATFAQWVAYPGYRNNTSYRGASSGWSKIYYSSKWKSTHNPAYDWCICVLEKDIGNVTGWLGSSVYTTNFALNNVDVRNIGYPAKFWSGDRQYFSRGTTSNAHNLWFESSASVIHGFSGGPTCRTSDDYVIGIISIRYEDHPEITVGPRITTDMIKIIKENS